MRRMLQPIALLAALSAPMSLPAQSALQGVDLESPAMTQANLTRADVESRLKMATADAPADFSRAWMNGLDLSGLDFSGANLRAARLNGVNLAGARLDLSLIHI